MDARGQLTNAYTQFLGRAPEAGQIDWRIGQLSRNNLANQLREIQGSAEAGAYRNRAQAPAAAAPVAAPQDSVSPLFNELSQFDQGAKNPIDIYNQALDKLGISDARTRVTGLRQSLINNQSLLDSLPGNVSARTADSLVTEGQRQRLVAQESAPIVGMGEQLNRQFGAAQGDYQGILGEAKTSTGIETDAQTARRGALMDRLKIQIDRTNDAEKKRQWQAEYDRQVALDAQAKADKERDYARQVLESDRAFAQASAPRATGGGGRSSGGGSSSASSEANDWAAIYADVQQGGIGKDGYTSPLTYNKIKSNYVSQGGSAATFDSRLGYLRNPNHKKLYPNAVQYR